MKTINEANFYNFNRVYSYNCTYNFVVGGRGIGKTFGAKEKAIRDAIKNGNQFIYLRRFKTELTSARTTFFADIIAKNKFPDYDFKVNGPHALMSHISKREDKKREWYVIGYFIALSTSQIQKSVSFPDVKTIIFDEFIIEKGTMHYLPEEHIIFNNFYSTVDRYTDKTRVLFLANSVSIMNPYFLEYEIIPDESKEIIVKKDGFLLAHFIDSENFKSDVYETKFGKFIADTEYAQYAVENQFADNANVMLGVKDSNYRYRFTLECKTGMFSVWLHEYTDEYVIQEKLPGQQNIFTMISDKMDNHKRLMSFSDKPLAYLRAAFRAGRIRFDKPSTRNTFTEIFKR